MQMLRRLQTRDMTGIAGWGDGRTTMEADRSGNGNGGKRDFATAADNTKPSKELRINA